MDVFDRAQKAELEQWRRLNEAPRSHEVAAVSSTACECGEEIDPGRRQALPGVQTCIDCARAAERGNKALKRT